MVRLAVEAGRPAALNRSGSPSSVGNGFLFGCNRAISIYAGGFLLQGCFTPESVLRAEGIRMKSG